MPFAKRIVEPRRLCGRAVPQDEDLCSISNVALSRSLRQLSDLARLACSLFHELEVEIVSTGQRVRALHARIGGIQRSTSELDPKQEAVPVSNLDVESKLASHYQAPWHQHRNVFHPSTRPPCVEELHRHAKQSLRARLRDEQQQPSSGRDGGATVSISAAPSMPACPSPHGAGRREARHLRTLPEGDVCEADAEPLQRQATAPADPDAEGVALSHRPRCPVPNVPTTLDKQTNWSCALPLPTPEERMKSESRVITSCVVPINVTEEVSVTASPPAISAFLRASFDRDASVRCSLVHSQSVLQRRRKLRRRKTISGIPRRVQQDLDSDESPVARERTVIVHVGPEACREELALTARLKTKDSGCQTEDFLIAVAAPSRRRIRSQWGQAVAVSLSHSAGNISALPDSGDSMFSASAGSRLRSRSLPREGGRLLDEGHEDSDEDDAEEDEEEEELSPFEVEDFLSGPGVHILKDEGESTDDQAVPELHLRQHPESPEHDWLQRGRSRLPQKSDMGSCEISSSSDTFSSPIHSVSNAGVLTSHMDHKEDHQSSSGNWSGSSSTCPSQTSETIPPAASPPLTGSSHCDSELSLNAAPHSGDDATTFILDPYQADRSQGLRGHRTGSFTSTAPDLLEDVGVSMASEGEWNYTHHHDQSCLPDISPDLSRDDEGSLECQSFASITTYESYMDKPPSEKADTISHYSVDTEGYYTSMHFDCGLKGSKSFTYNYAAHEQRQATYRGHETLGSQYHSLRKPKVKPAPPKRSSSLKKISGGWNEPKITGVQHLPVSSRERKLQLDLAGSSSQLEGEESLEAWRAENASSAPDDSLFGFTETHSFKDEGAVQSDYADLWLLNDLKSNDPYRSLSNSSTATGTTVIECIKSQESSESQTSQSASRATTPSLPSGENEFKLPSPEKFVGLASPSSGYSSQSETPTSSFPSAFFPSPLSPTSGKRKPKVPERKSSLSSLQQRSSKRELELPVIPPTHLDLSALHGVDKPSARRNPVHRLHQNKQKIPAGTSTRAEAFGATTAITPTVLQSVQLRSVERPNAHNATRPKCPTVTFITPPANTKLFELRKPPPYRPLEPPVQDHCEADHSSSRFQQDRLAPVSLWNKPGLPAQVDLDDEVNEVNVATDSTAGLGEQRQEELWPASLESDHSQHCDGTNAGLLSFTGSSTAQQSQSLNQVPDVMHQSETCTSSHASSPEGNETSGFSTRSASLDIGEDGSTPDTEDYFSKDSTPSDVMLSPLTDESKTEDEVFLSPTKSRTTEDLFAMIHRSKRKVLGRKDSGDSCVRNCSAAASSNFPSSNTLTPPTTPVAPTTPTTPTNMQRAPGPIYRSAKKSSTSNEEFKLLLLKKGSRSDSSYRMSATEILKSPVAPKSPGDCVTEWLTQPEEPLSPQQYQLSPEPPEQISSPFPKANVEGFTGKAFPSTASARQGRSRAPPVANSSRYSTRSRLYTAPMQAISEGETENSDGSPHDDRSS
ncbi:Nance-Horan syndrome protein isoform X2 [Denticeps clupeoides]|uniref:Nance-Horan syndrome protein isoform X2 n=1 Tax=Denticeps clupeoides TaxID=299321 RepID=UPI0010A58EC8|nr:Nance-Horan syndrome protein isoform X2 [Denticeps clupeoides]